MARKWTGVLDHLDEATKLLDGDKGAREHLRSALKMLAELRKLTTEPSDPSNVQKIKRHAANAEATVQAALTVLERGNDLTST